MKSVPKTSKDESVASSSSLSSMDFTVSSPMEQYLYSNGLFPTKSISLISGLAPEQI